jgi:uncharacterized membrane protein YkoI
MGVLRTSIFALLILGTAAGAYPDEPRGAVVASASVSMDQAVKMAEQRFKARVVRAEAQHEGVHTVYILKLLNDAGHVWTVRVDATNGAIL